MHESERNIQSELKAFRLNGMASACAVLVEHDGGSTIQSSRWLIDTCSRLRMRTGKCAALPTR